MSKKPIELTAEQRKLAEQYEKEQNAKIEAAQNNQKKVETMKVEAAAIAKYLAGLGIKSRRT